MLTTELLCEIPRANSDWDVWGYSKKNWMVKNRVPEKAGKKNQSAKRNQINKGVWKKWNLT
jgi:hypothetical protein